MRTLKMIWLMFVCFYYAVLTPGSVDYHRGEEQFLWGALVLSILQSTIAMVLLWFFGWSIEAAIFLGAVAGIWTFIGAAMYPSLASILEKIEREQRQRASDQEFRQRALERNKPILDKARFNQLAQDNPEAAKEYLKKAWTLMDKNKAHKIEYEHLKNYTRLRYEMRRLGMKV